MIYEEVSATEPIRQGDILVNIPKVDFSLEKFLVIDEENEARQVTWNEVLEGADEQLTALVAVRRVSGIVITQDCDAFRSQYICLAEIKPYSEVNRANPQNANSWQKQLVRHSREQIKYFYLPEDRDRGIPQRSVADFRSVVRVQREDLERLSNLRVGRLLDEPYEHFRETLAQFFRRYPYNEWYPLTKEEFEAYRSGCSEETSPYPWQE